MFTQNTFSCTYLLLLCLFLFACGQKEDFNFCEENCGEVHVYGRVQNMETGLGVAKNPIKIGWEKNDVCFFCSTDNIANIKTDKEGNFDLVLNIDTTNFETKNLVFTASFNEKVFCPWGTGNSYERHYDMNKIGTYEIVYQAYPKVNYTLNLSYSPDNDIDSVKVLHNFHGGWWDYGYDYTWALQDGAQENLSKKITTGAGAITLIMWKKHVKSSNQWLNFSDSIRCESKKENVFNIVF